MMAPITMISYGSAGDHRVSPSSRSAASGASRRSRAMLARVPVRVSAARITISAMRKRRLAFMGDTGCQTQNLGDILPGRVDDGVGVLGEPTGNGR